MSSPDHEPGRTFLFTDVVDSTTLWQQAESAMGEALRLHDRLLTAAFSEAGGEIVKHTGDGLMVQFPTPRPAVDAAVTAQLSLTEAPWPSDAVIRVRMGIHHGPAEQRDGDWFGTSVNTSARVMGAAHGGQVLVSSTVVELLGADRFVDLGSHRFKGLAAPMRIFHVDAPGLDPVDKHPPPAALPTRVVVLPDSDGALLGREGEVERVRSLLTVRRALTLVGPAGIGKTRLALEIARAEVPDRPDGVVVVPLDRPSVVEAVADGLGLARAPASMDGLAALLAGRDLLLVLDGADRRTDAVAALVDALPEERDCRILITSGAPVGLHDERVHTVGPPQDHGIGLLRAGLAELPAPPTVTDRDIEEICDLLDGNPLAITLAGRRIAELGAAAFIAELDQGGSGASDVDEIISRSLELFDADRRRVLDAAAQFDTSFRPEDLAVMVDEPVAHVRTHLAEMTTLSMVRPVGHDRNQLARALRANRRRALRGSDPGKAWAGAHARLVCESVLGLAPALRGRDERTARNALRHLLPELRRAASHLFAIDPDPVWATIAALAPFESIWLHDVGRLAADLVADVVLDDVPAMVLTQAASARSAAADLAGAERLGRLAVARADRSSGHPWSVLGNALLSAGQVAEATTLIDEGVQVAAATGDPFDLALSASGQSIFAFWSRDEPLAVAAGRLALDAAESSESETALASATGALGTALVRTDPDQARELLELGVDVAVDIGNDAHELIARRGLGLLGRIRKDWALAFPALVTAMTRADELGEELEYRIAADLLINCTAKAGLPEVALTLRRALGQAELLSTPHTDAVSTEARDSLGPVERIRIASHAGRLGRRDLLAWLRGELEARTPAGW